MVEQSEPHTPQADQPPDSPLESYPDQGSRDAAENSSERERESVSLGDLSPAEVVALHRYALEVHDQTTGTDPATDAMKRKTGGSLYDWVTAEVDKLAKTDVPRLEAIVTAFADSPLPGDRIELGLETIAIVTKVSPAVGVKLWDRLLRDPEDEVRDRAHDMLNEVMSGDFADDNKFRAETGMTREDVSSLFETYRRARRGKNIFDLGRVALRRLLGLPEA